VIAISSREILLGVNSELGPIDPQMFLPDIGVVPCELVAKDKTKDPIIRGLADTTVKRMRRLAKKILQKGMLSSKTSPQIDRVIRSNRISIYIWLSRSSNRFRRSAGFRINCILDETRRRFMEKGLASIYTV